ncbi:MAG: carotenoid 1,2-hydratase, partial [Rhodothermales bacterium]|nr:carotenoid 1,2-hydratase [Rhodothermales bacterium]
MRRFVWTVLGAAGVLWVLATLLSTEGESVVGSISVAEALQGDTTGYRRATFPASIRFPADHGAHPEYKTEWWYFTGNLGTESGRPFGYQFTLFRTALTPDSTAGSSPWRSNQLYTAHFAVSDIEAGRFYSSERAARSAVGLAGVEVAPLRAWLEDWSLEQVGPTGLDARLRATEGDYAIDLRLTPTRQPLLHGYDGFSPKDADSTNASYYYSYTRLASEGFVVVGSDTLRVSGSTWMDHEWSTSALGPGQVGWDWFALRLSDGTDMMYFQVRDTVGDTPFVEGTVRGPNGEVTRLSPESVTFRATDRWESPETRIVYPSGW